MAAAVATAIRRYLDGDRDALTDLVRRIQPWLHRVALNHRLNHHSAEDVVQETLLALIQNIHKLRDPDAGLGWLTVIARNEAIHSIKADRRVALPGDRLEWESLAAPDDPERTATAALTRTVITDAIAKLPARGGQVLRLAFLADERDYAAISAALDMPVGSIGPTRQRALRRMRELLPAELEWDLDASA